MQTRASTPSDFDAILALNEDAVAYLSPLDAARLSLLDRESALHRVVEERGVVVAFLLALREGVAYDSPNYTWFARRYERFLYVDRIVVAGKMRSNGAGSLLYKDLFAFASQSAVPLIACEYDVEPPNAGSARFHARFGFHEVGRQSVAGGRKIVSLQAIDISSNSDAMLERKSAH